MKALIALTQDLPIGTNLGLTQFLWMLVSGALLPRRGAIFPALKATGLSDEETRRSWVAFRKGVWQINILLQSWQAYVSGREDWQARRYEGYQPIPVDITAFWRPALKDCPSKHYHPTAQRALPAVVLGVVGQVGEINGRRLALPRWIERVQPKDPKENRLWQELLKKVKLRLALNEIAVLDAGVKIRDLQAVQLERYALRLAKNFTARRNFLPEYGNKGRKPKYGGLVRPLARKRKDKTLPATPPDEQLTWQENGREIRARIWRNLVLPHTVPDPKNSTFDVYAIDDPDFEDPWLLATPVKLKAESVRAIYRDRWPGE